MQQAQTNGAAQPSSEPKTEGKTINLKTKEGEKWKTLGTLFIRADLSGGVATLYKDDGTKVEDVAVFVNDGKFKGSKKA